MRLRKPTLAALAATALAIGLALLLAGGADTRASQEADEAVAGEPTVTIVSPRNGARQRSHAVVIKVEVENFRLAPGRFGSAPQLGEGHLRFSLNRVPDCVDPVKLQHAINSPLGKGRLVGASFDYAEFAGPNGVLAERLGSAGSYSPATRPEIYYHQLHPGFYRLVVNLAHNNGAPAGAHDVTNFQVLPRPGAEPKPCPKGKVPSADAAG